ncbi:MAG: hypothetical protein ACE1Y7_05190 [Lysobacteraceae bacterium]
MKTAINLATRPCANQRPFWLLAGFLLLVSVVATAWVATDGVLTWRQRTTTRARLSELSRQQSQLAARQAQLESALLDPATQALLQRVGFLNRVIRQKSFSWTGFFFELQQHLPAQARVLSVSPTLQADGTVEVELRLGGRSPAAVNQCLESLEQGEKFRRVTLHAQAQSTARADAVVADVSAIYVEE